MMDNIHPLLEIKNLKVTFPNKKENVLAVDGVNCSLVRGKTLGIVGESGSGKSTLARAVMQLVPSSGGEILFDGIDLSPLNRKELREIRKRMQMVFQDPGGSLNEYMRVGKIITEPLLVHGIARGKELKSRAEDLLIQVGLKKEDANRFPHEFSGGQKQRIAIARAISLEPELLVCDEPTSALDVTVQAKILNLLSELRERLGLTIVFITHDLAVVNEFCDEVLVMSKGKIVERGCKQEVIHNPTHKITKELIASSYA
jgi:ABC-type oligopeptide transport system ATPase subunit